MNNIEPVAVVGAKRTPVGRFGGALASFSAVSLGEIAAKEAVKQSKVPIESISLSVFGQVLQAGSGQNPARQVALGSGMNQSSSAFTVNMVCGSGLKAVYLASNAIRFGGHQIVLAGGVESMSNAPYYCKKTRWGIGYGNMFLEDGMLADGLTDAYSKKHMGEAAEWVAEKYKISRKNMDEYAYSSHVKAIEKKNSLKSEITPITIGSKVLDCDEGPRETSVEKLSSLKPVFKKGGSVTAGNSSSINDGGAAVVLASKKAVKEMGLKPLCWIREGVDGGVAPKEVLMSPLSVFENLKNTTNFTVKDFGIIEINEAFACQMVALQRKLEVDEGKLNPLGGAVSLGHPIGCSGARIAVSLASQLKNSEKELAFGTLCLGGGNGTGLIFQRSLD
tara:strand:- start:1244 stop:2416 length:1173 start_codon:yes stop_codon:yes gene_type:complete